MHVPIKFLPNFTDPARINENSDLRSEAKKFADSFSQAQGQTFQLEHSSHEDFGSLLKTPNPDTKVEYHIVDRENKLSLTEDAQSVLATEWVRQEAGTKAAAYLEGDTFFSELNSDRVSLDAPISPLKGSESYNEVNDISLTSGFTIGYVDKQHNETVNLEAPKSSLKSGEGYKWSHDTQLSSDFSKSIDDEHLILSSNAKFFLTTAQANSEHAAAGSDTDATLPSTIIPTTQILERPQTSVERIRIEKNATEYTSSTFEFDHLPLGHLHEDGTFLNNPVKNGAKKSRADFSNLLRGLELTSETLSGPYPLEKLGTLNELLKASITLPIKTWLKASASSLHYSMFPVNENGSENYTLGRVLQSVIGAKGSPFVNLEQNSAQFAMPTTLRFSSKNNISPKHEIGNVFSVEKEALATDILRNAAMVKFSAIGDLNARNPNDNQFDKSISVDVPRTYKLDMSLNTWQKVLSSQISKAALENITKLQFTINPKKLGRVSVNLQMDAGNVNVSIFSSNGHVANILQTSEGKLETLLSDHGMKLASYNVSSEQNGRDKRDRAPTNGRNSEIVERNGSKTAGVLQSEAKSRPSTTHNGDYDYLV